MKFNRTTTGVGTIYTISGKEYEIRIRKPYGYDTWRVETAEIISNENGTSRIWNELNRFNHLNDAKAYVREIA